MPKKLSPMPVEKLLFFPTALWMNFPCGSKQKSTYPHKNPLLLILLPNELLNIYIYNLITRKEMDYAFYL